MAKHVLLLLVFLATATSAAGRQKAAPVEVASSTVECLKEFHATPQAVLFAKFHEAPISVRLRLLTTLLGLVGALGLVEAGAAGATSLALPRGAVAAGAAGTYAAVLASEGLPGKLFASCTLVLAAAAVFALRLRLPAAAACTLTALGLCGADAAAMLVGAPSHAASAGALAHARSLLPLALDAAVATDGGKIALLLLPLSIVAFTHLVDPNGAQFPWMVQTGRVFFARLGSPEQQASLKAIRAWAMTHKPSLLTTTHWWYSDLPPDERKRFDSIALSDTMRDAFAPNFPRSHYDVAVLNDMNEIYVSGPTHANTSDTVFYTKHVDGPYAFIPYGAVYRTILALDENTEISTIFPMVPTRKAAACGDALLFDFHKNVHYIAEDPTQKNKQQRIVIKIHYAVFPKALPFFGRLLGRLTVNYNAAFRALFNFTKVPTTPVERFSAWNVNFWTVAYNSAETYVGFNNFAYLLASLALARGLGDMRVFLALTSYIHYLRYLGTYYYRHTNGPLSYGGFKRDVLLYKTLALFQLFYHFTSGFSPAATLATPLLAPCVALIALGYATSLKATAALGVERTYFGAELGFCEAKWITEFPYGYFPHPMIVSQLVALAGIHLSPAVRATIPHAVPLHVALYVAHMLQEEFDFHKKSKAACGDGAPTGGDKKCA